MLPVSALDRFAEEELPKEIHEQLLFANGKPTTRVSFTTDVVFRHILPSLLSTSVLDQQSLAAVTAAEPLLPRLLTLREELEGLDTEPVRFFRAYENFRDETDFDEARVRLSSAALLRLGFSIEKLVRYLGGPHIGAHRDTKALRRRLSLGVPPRVLEPFLRLLRLGAPSYVNAHGSNANFMDYYRYGNHKSVTTNEEEFRKVMVKDSKRGNILVLDQRLLPFIPHMHLTPQGIVDLDNKWKSARPVFDSTSRPEPWSMAVNDWTSKDDEGDVTFPGSFTRFCQWIWNLRITYPNEPIYLGDDDVRNAFRLFKYNPAGVAMNGYRACGVLAFATGCTFGGETSPAIWDTGAQARQFHSRYLWSHEPAETIAKARQYLDKVRLQSADDDTRPFARANADSKNPGVVRDGTREPPPYTMQVDDALYGDVSRHFRRTLAASIVGLLETFGGTIPQQEDLIATDKLHLQYNEQRQALGRRPDSRALAVDISDKRRDKTVQYMASEGWIDARTDATILEYAQLNGLLESAAEDFPWGLAQLLVLQDHIRNHIGVMFRFATRNEARRRKVAAIQATMPANLRYRLKFLESTTIAKWMWKDRTRIPVSAKVRAAVRVIYESLRRGDPWRAYIGHIIPRDPYGSMWGDASHTCLGFLIPCLKIWCILPYGRVLFERIKKGDVHINPLEFIAILLQFLAAKLRYVQRPSLFPPFPIMGTFGDNTSANAWWRKISTKSTVGQNLLRYYAEYERLSQITSVTRHIPGKDNKEADLISRPHELYSPHLPHVYNVPLPVLVRKVSQQIKKLKSWEIFLPSPELLSDLRSMLSSASLMEVPNARVNYGRLVPAEKISSTGATSDTYPVIYL